MTNRRDYHKRTTREREGRYVRLAEYMLASPAWISLDTVSRALYVEIARRYRGPNSNNGKIPFSVREAAAALSVSRSTANRAFKLLVERGLLDIAKRSGFTVKGRVSMEWLLTEFPDDRESGATPARKDFMRWSPEKENHSLTSDTHSLTSEPPLALRRDRVA
jgi:DNA-binding transcriptional MocR family regulator